MINRDEQMLTVFFPNPWLDPVRQRYVAEPDWSRLEPWMQLRQRFAQQGWRPFFCNGGVDSAAFNSYFHGEDRVD